jgi:dihydrofolate reductase
VRKVTVFNHTSLDGYFADANGDMSWAHRNADAEWNQYSAENAEQGVADFLFGRRTYEMMASFWPSPQGMKSEPKIAERMNSAKKLVFSRTLDKATWNNTTLVKEDLIGYVRKLKSEAGQDLMIFGSGTIVSQLTQERLIDSYTVVVNPLVVGSGKNMFDGVREQARLKLVDSRAFKNGNMVLSYELKK